MLAFELKSLVAAAALASGVVLAGVSSPTPTSDDLSAQQSAAIAAIADRAMVKQRIPGMAIGIGHQGKMVYASGFGVRDRGKAVDENTVFAIRSITKQFTATCVMLLVQGGRVRLDSPIERYLPGVPHGHEVTVRELLDQTSGLADYSSQPALQRALHPHLLTELKPATLIGFIASEPLEFQPGTKFEYSNTNYVLAGMLVQAVSGESYADFLQTRIFVPLGLHEMQYLRTSVPKGPDASHGYKVVKGRFVLLPPFTMSWAAGAGALASDVHDLIAWD